MRKQNEKAIEELLKYYSRKGYSPETIKRWTIMAVEYIVFLENNDKTVDDIGDLLNSEGKVVQKEQFGAKEFIDTKTQYSQTYLLYIHKVLKRMYTGWNKHFPIDNEEFPKIKQEPERLMFTTEELRKIQETARKIWIQKDEKQGENIIGLRDYCCILIGIDCGPRRYQITRLNIEHYNNKTGTLFIPAAKGGRNTNRMLNEFTKNALTYYIIKRKEIPVQTNAMFLTTTGKRITKSTLSERVTYILKEANIYRKGVGYHSFRRAKSWRLKQIGFTEEAINDIMGWKIGSKMSHIYGMLDQTDLQKKATEQDNIFKNQ